MVTALIGAVAFVRFGHTSQVRSDTGIASTPDTTATRRPNDEVAADDSPAPLNEPGGLITGPQGLRTASTQSVIDNRVLMVGDSVLQGAAPYVPDKLSSWSIIADTRVGRFLDEAIRVVKQRSAKDLGKIVVLNLGNNYGGDQVVFQAQVEEMLGLLSTVEHVLWVNMGEFEKAQGEVNAVLRSELLTHPNLTLLDWQTLWKTEPGYTGNDHLHLTPTGADAYAALVANGVTRVTAAAKETPAPSPKSAKISTKGQIPVSTSVRRKSYGSTTTSTYKAVTPTSVVELSVPSTTAGGSVSAPPTAVTPTTVPTPTSLAAPTTSHP